MSRRVGRNAVTAAFNDVVLLGARVLFGGVFLAHGLQKYNNGFDSVEKLLHGFGVPSADIAAQELAYLEIIGGGLLALGLLAPLAGVLLAADMAMFIYFAHPIRVVFADKGGWELAAALGAGALVLGVVAPGRISLDQLLTWPVRRRMAQRRAEPDETALGIPVQESVSVRHWQPNL